MISESTDLSVGEAFAELERSIPEPNALVASLVGRCAPDAGVAAAVTRQRLLLPERRRPRLSPSSLACLEAALRHGSFYYTFGIRDELLTGWTAADRRWQTGFLQHHGVVRSVGNSDAHIEVHDQTHAMLGIAWWPGITLEQFVYASWISEGTASYHYYYTDAILEPRCADHAGLVDTTKILKLHTCDACNLPQNLFFNLGEEERRRMLQTAHEYARQATRFYRRELAEIRERIFHGVGPVTRNPTNLAGNLRDSLRYAYHLYPLLRNRQLAPYLESLRAWQRAPSLADFALRAGTLVAVMAGVSDYPGPHWERGLRWRRHLFVAQDILLRTGMLLAQGELGLRELTEPERAVLADARDEAAEIVDEIGDAADMRSALEPDPPAALTRRIEGVFQGLAASGEDDGGMRMAGLMAAATGYDLSLVLAATEPNAEALAASPDLTLFATSLTRLLRERLPRTMVLCDRAGLGRPLAEEFRCSLARWEATREPEIDGRCPAFDEQLQRIVTWLGRRPVAREGWAPVLAERARLEYRLLRYCTWASVQSDVRPIYDPLMTSEPPLLRRAATAELVETTLDLRAAASVDDDPPAPRAVTYALTMLDGRACMVELAPPMLAVLRIIGTGSFAEEQLVAAAAADLGAEEAGRAVAGLVTFKILERFVPDPSLRRGTHGGQRSFVGAAS